MFIILKFIIAEGLINEYQPTGWIQDADLVSMQKAMTANTKTANAS